MYYLNFSETILSLSVLSQFTVSRNSFGARRLVMAIQLNKKPIVLAKPNQHPNRKVNTQVFVKTTISSSYYRGFFYTIYISTTKIAMPPSPNARTYVIPGA